MARRVKPGQEKRTRRLYEPHWWNIELEAHFLEAYFKFFHPLFQTTDAQ
jgi:hypothetical protein